VLGGAYAFGGRLEAGIRLPLYLQDGATTDPSLMYGEPPARGAAHGNLTLHGKLEMVRQHTTAGMLTAGVSVSLALPTATASEFAGSADPAARGQVLLALSPELADHRLTLLANVGAVLRSTVEFHDVRQGDALAWGLGGAYRATQALTAVAELFGEVEASGRLGRPTAGTTMAPSSALVTIEALAGLRFAVDSRLALGVAAGRGLTRGFGAPGFRGVLTVTFTPNAPELSPLPAHAHARGIDPDGDGIPDARDRCPDQPEDRDGFEDDDGCPDLDDDGDGIPDAHDQCPRVPEDVDGFDDDDGCPDVDNDHDGIPDAKDRCPLAAEDADGFEDDDGCPDDDNDHDGIPDRVDHCPLQPETINGNVDDDGCPDAGAGLVTLAGSRIELGEPIRFTADDKLAPESFNVLGQLAATLRAHTELLRIRLGVHLQPTGQPLVDQATSDRRARALRDWLVQWGIDAQRLVPRGHGSSRPVVRPDQNDAAARNERVELDILAHT